MMMTGWELEKANEDLLFKRLKKIKMFLKEYSLATLSRDNSILLIIRKYHPQLNCPPDDRDHPSGNYRICLAYYSISSTTYFLLPGRFTYLNISMKYDPHIQNFSITISTKEMTRTTNIPELARKLNNYAPKTEEELENIFAGLANELPVVEKKKPITQTTVESGIIGTLQQSDFEDWWTSDKIKIPFWDEQELTITFIDLNPNEDVDFLDEADMLLSRFFTKTSSDRLAISKYVYQNCMDFLNTIGYDEEDEALWSMQQAEDVWQFVTCTHLYVSREPYKDKGVYLQLICKCEWEQEHGLQLVYNKAGKLVRVSADDGHILGDGAL